MIHISHEPLKKSLTPLKTLWQACDLKKCLYIYIYIIKKHYAYLTICQVRHWLDIF